MDERKSGWRRSDGFDDIVSALRLLVPSSHSSCDSSAVGIVDPLLLDSGPSRLSVVQLAEHPLLWEFCPHGCTDLWIEAARPFFQSYLLVRANGSPCEKGESVIRFMSLPSRCLVRRRGGKAATQRLKAKLRYVGLAARALVEGGLPVPAGPLPSDS